MAIVVPPDSTGKQVETFVPATGTDHRQGNVIADDTVLAARAKVQGADPGSTDYGLTVRDVRGNAALPVFTVVAPTTSGGLVIYHVVALGTANAANIKASAGQVFGWNIFNNAAYPIYVKFHNTAGTPTAGAGVVHTIGVQAGAGRDFTSDVGIAFSTGIGITIVQDIADAGTTVLAASDCVVEVYYK